MKHLRLRSFLTVLILTPALCQAAGQRDFAGTWVVRVDDRNLFVLALTAEGSELRGSWEHPVHYTSRGPGAVRGEAFGDLRGGIRRDLVVQSRLDGETLHLTIRNENDPKDEETLAMTVNGDHAALSREPATGEVFVLERAAPGARAATDWEPNRLYTASDSEFPSAEMKALFDEDQRVRKQKDADWNTIAKTDAERRERTRALLAAGSLHTGKDYEEAAFIFQHSDTAGDYLLAHTLGMVAISKGDSRAIWIAATTLDRYLQKIGQKQIFGTQFRVTQGTWTHEPYDRSLISDALRKQLLESTQAEQDEFLKTLPAQK